MQRDLTFHALTDEELDRLEESALRDLGDGRGRSYVQRQAIALNYVRALVERKIRESERRLGLRGSPTVTRGRRDES